MSSIPDLLRSLVARASPGPWRAHPTEALQNVRSPHVLRDRRGIMVATYDGDYRDADVKSRCCASCAETQQEEERT